MQYLIIKVNHLPMAEEFIYDEEGRIKDPDVAHDVAKLEDKARVKEKQLQKEAQTGLSETQSNNKELMEGLLSKYPDAFEKKVDDKSRDVLIMFPAGDERDTSLIFQRHPVVLSQEGFIHMNIEDILGGVDKINYTNLLDYLHDKKGSLGSPSTAGWEQIPVSKLLSKEDQTLYINSSIEICPVNLDSERARKSFKAALGSSQEWGKESNEIAKVKASRQTPQAILEEL